MASEEQIKESRILWNYAQLKLFVFSGPVIRPHKTNLFAIVLRFMSLRSVLIV